MALPRNWFILAPSYPLVNYLVQELGSLNWLCLSRLFSSESGTLSCRNWKTCTEMVSNLQQTSKFIKKRFFAHTCKSCKCRCVENMQVSKSAENCWTVFMTPGTGHCLPSKNDLIVGRHGSKGLLNLCGSELLVGAQCKCTISSEFGKSAKSLIWRHPPSWSLGWQLTIYYSSLFLNILNSDVYKPKNTYCAYCTFVVH